MMKIRKSAIAILISSVAVLLLCVVYFTYMLPFLNFMFNPLEYNSKKNPTVVIGADESLIDESKYKKTENDPANPYIRPISTPEPQQIGTIGEPREQTYVDFELPKNATNVLVLGADEAAGLTDSIFIVSIDNETKMIKIISIPRDTYVIYRDVVIKGLKDYGWYEGKGVHKINIAPLIGEEVISYQGGKFKNKGINFMCSVIEGMLGESFHIDDYVYINFDGFMEMVEVFGGIWITVDETIYNQYGQMLVPEGRNYLSPKEALFYVRTRKRFDSNGNNLGSMGDSYRKELQINFIKEMLNQYVTKESIEKAPEILNSLKANVFHSISDVDKLFKYTNIASDFVQKKYFVDFLIITGNEIDPFNDDASYVEIIRTT